MKKKTTIIPGNSHVTLSVLGKCSIYKLMASADLYSKGSGSRVIAQVQDLLSNLLYLLKQDPV
jgi:hypothetical protein